MRLQLGTPLLLVVVLGTASPGTAATIGTRGGRGAASADRPLWETSPGTSRLRHARTVSPDGGGSQVSGSPPEEASAIVAGPPPDASPGVGTSEPPDELRPLLDVDELVALELNRTRATPRPPTAASAATSTPLPVAASGQPGADKDLSSQLAEVLKNIFDESAARGQPTTQPPRVDLAPQKPPSASTGDSAKFDEFLPQLEDALKGVLVNHKPAEPQPPPTGQLPPPQTPKVPDTEEHLKHILPILEEEISSILKDSEAKMNATTSRPDLPPVNPATTIGRPSKSDAEEHLKHFLPALEEAFASILKDSGAKAPTTAGKPVLPPAFPTKPATRRPSQSDAEEELKHILPTLEEALGSILKDTEAKPATTTGRPVPPPVRPPTTAGGTQFAAVLPQLEEAIRSVLDEAALEQQAAARRRTTPPSAWQPTPPTSKDYGFGKFLPELERTFGDILRNRESDHSATFTSTVKTPIRPTIVPTEETLSFQNNVVEPDSPPSHSEHLF